MSLVCNINDFKTGIKLNKLLCEQTEKHSSFAFHSISASLLCSPSSSSQPVLEMLLSKPSPRSFSFIGYPGGVVGSWKVHSCHRSQKNWVEKLTCQG